MAGQIRKRNRRPHMSRDMERLILSEHQEGYSPTEIERRLQQLPEGERRRLLLYDPVTERTHYDDVPTYDQVKRVIQRSGHKDLSGDWRAGDADTEPEDARAILDVLRVAIVSTEGRRKNFTKEEARKIALLSRLMPSANPWLIWRLSLLWLQCEREGDDTAGLDIFLAFKPWEEAGQDAYLKAMADRSIPQEPFLVGFLGMEAFVKLGWLSAEDLQKSDSEKGES